MRSRTEKKIKINFSTYYITKELKNQLFFFSGAPLVEMKEIFYLPVLDHFRSWRVHVWGSVMEVTEASTKCTIILIPTFNMGYLVPWKGRQ